MNHIQSKLRAFTLVELLIVVTIIGIASALVVPYVGARTDLRVSAVARTLISDLQYAQNLAITTRQSHGIWFEANRYTIQRFSTGGATTIKHPVSKDTFVVQMGPTGKDVYSGIAMPLVNVRQGASRLVFDSMGTPMAFDGTTSISTTSAALVSLSAGGTTIVIRIEPFTGEVNVE